MQPRELLEEAKTLLSDPSKWTKSGWYAVNREGKYAESTAPEACAWCAIGALIKVAKEKGSLADSLSLGKAMSFMDWGVGNFSQRIAIWNDYSTTTHADLMQRFNIAIQAAS